MTPMIPHTSEHQEEKMTTVIADDLHIKGTITFATSLMIKGTLEGEIVSQGLLVVGPTAKIAATIATKSLVSHGEIKGDVTATEQVVLKETSVQTGNITTPYIVVENGSVFNGSCVMKREEVLAPPDFEASNESEAQGAGGEGTEAEAAAPETQTTQNSTDPSEHGLGEPGAQGPGAEEPDQKMENEQDERRKTKDEEGSEFSLRSKWRKKELF